MTSLPADRQRDADRRAGNIHPLSIKLRATARGVAYAFSVLRGGRILSARTLLPEPLNDPYSKRRFEGLKAGGKARR
ncbi:MAG TPA: hypothetical protein VIG30_14980 [Ktedonobacterales bacterium]